MRGCAQGERSGRGLLRKWACPRRMAGRNEVGVASRRGGVASRERGRGLEVSGSRSGPRDLNGGI